MLFLEIGTFIFCNKFLNILLLILLIYVCIKVYNKSINSRNYYKCPNCGETCKTEHMTSTHCSVCGAELKEIRIKKDE